MIIEMILIQTVERWDENYRLGIVRGLEKERKWFFREDSNDSGDF